MRMIGLSHSAEEKLIRYLLDQSGAADKSGEQVRFTASFTHEEIGQIIGSTRETVTRLFADFKRKGLVQVKGSTVTINPAALAQNCSISERRRRKSILSAGRLSAKTYPETLGVNSQNYTNLVE